MIKGIRPIEQKGGTVMIKLREWVADDSAELLLISILGESPGNNRPRKALRKRDRIVLKKPKKRPGDPPLKPPPPQKPSKPGKHPRKPGDPRRAPTKGDNFHKNRKDDK